MDDDDRDQGGLYEDVGVLAGTCEPVDGGEVIEVIGIIYPGPFGSEDVRYMTLPAAKSLLVDLRDAIEAAIKHKQGEPGDEQYN